ncbi:MAG: hypothetical protein HON04_11430 [Planctomicrobium sp.]|jgi:hypothetical protein|nr:hypothetical protein [Planctomicrobium sp.]
MTNSPTDNGPNVASLVGWYAFFTLLTFVCVITAKLINTGPLSSANDRSRWCTVYSLIEENTYQIDEIRQRSGWDTIDLVRHNDHFYSTKPPLLPRIVAEYYRVIKLATGLNLTDNTDSVTNIILFLINIIPMAIAMWLMFKLIRRYCTNTFGQFFLITATCWGTLLVPFLAVFNNHTIGTTFIIYSLYLAITIVAEEKKCWWRFAICGLCAAFGVCNELPAAAYGLALFFILLKTDPKRTLLAFVPMALIPLGGFFLTNYHATGGWKPFYLYYGTEKYRFVFDGKPSYWLDPQGVDQAKDSFAVYFMHCMVGHHGIFSLTPIFLITLVSWLTPNLWWKSKLKPFHILGILLSIIVIAFYMTKTENYNYGGVSVALRWTLWLTPFWLLIMLPIIDRFGNSLFLRMPAILLLSISLFSAWYPANAPWTQPWIFKVMENMETQDKKKWIDYSTPRPKFDRKVYSWIGALPEGDLQPDYWIEIVTQNSDGTTGFIRLEDAGPTENDVRKLIVTRNESAKVYLFDGRRMEKGSPPAGYISNEDGTEVTRQELDFFRGVPKRRAYGSSRIRYVGTGIRKDAFKAHVGYTYVEVPDEEGKRNRYQRDVWFSEEVPFGFFQFEDKVTDLETKSLLSQQNWKLKAAGKFLPRIETFSQ